MALEYTILNATCEDWKQVVDLSTKFDHWGMAYEDYFVWKKAFGEDESLFLAAKGTDGELLGFVCRANYETNVAAIGMYYVQPRYRGQGIGDGLFNQIMKNPIAKRYNFGLWGTTSANMSTKYATRRGFDKRPDWILKTLAVHNASTARIAHLAEGIKVVDASKVDFDKVAAYDRTVSTEIDRTQWVQAWINHLTGWSKVAIDASGAVIGYCTARIVSLNRMFVAPVYADNKNVAAALIKAVLDDDRAQAVIGERLFFAPSNNTEMHELVMMLSDGQCKHKGDQVWQFTESLPKVDISKVFGISDPALSFI